MRHFYRLSEFSMEEVQRFLQRAAEFKLNPYSNCLDRRQLALIFLNPSLRTRCSFEVAIRQMGGGFSTLEGQSLWKLETQFGVRMDEDKTEHVKEAVGVLSRYFDGLGLRSFARGENKEEDLADRTFTTFMDHSQVPVFNMESASYHPCQALADLMTLQELFGGLKGRRLTIIWAQHPLSLPMAVPNSILLAATQMGMDVTLGHPQGFEIQPGILSMAEVLAERSGGKLRIINDREEAVRDTEVIYAKAWGGLSRYEDPEGEKALRQQHQNWIVDSELMALTRRAYFMHCLPVRRNVVVTDEVIDSARSVIFHQAENRLHAQKAILEWIFS
ncbi:MAG: N-acetylornithine carbamoyltransferase [Planctomycetes bacterium]|nr:N-acetylornithine carbamoyltransferase [Planctomycetota bacterium]